MKHIELFKDGFDNTINDKIQPENYPYVGNDGVSGEIVYTKIPEPNWVTFTAKEDNSSIGLESLSANQTLWYSTDTITWNTFDTTTNISLNNGDKVYIKGILSVANPYSDYTQFKMTGKIAASGNSNALWNYEDLEAPIKGNCGRQMFFGCTSLTTAPALPATKLVYGCYMHMFGGCTALTTAPELPATTLARECYCCMFINCTSLTIPPALPATTLPDTCYNSMFQGCTSLTTAPELPATTLDDSCYGFMFEGCTSLTTSPVLPATTLTMYCYQCMFRGCINLNHITCLAKNISARDCTNNWVYNVSSTGTFIKHPDMKSWKTGNKGIPSNWTIVNAEL